MNPASKAAQVKINNVIDMAITFTAMNRVFEKKSKVKITRRLIQTLSKLASDGGADSFERVHAEFCEWFVANISTAEKKGRDGKIVKKSGPASYGHAAKVLDIALKVYVYYCHLPSRQKATRLTRSLHGAVDTPILKHLRERYKKAAVSARTIEQIDRKKYGNLQDLIKRHIKDEFNDAIWPVQYDDIMWSRLNRELSA